MAGVASAVLRLPLLRPLVLVLALFGVLGTRERLLERRVPTRRRLGEREASPLRPSPCALSRRDLVLLYRKTFCRRTCGVGSGCPGGRASSRGVGSGFGHGSDTNCGGVGCHAEARPPDQFWPMSLVRLTASVLARVSW